MMRRFGLLSLCCPLVLAVTLESKFEYEHDLCELDTWKTIPVSIHSSLVVNPFDSASILKPVSALDCVSRVLHHVLQKNLSKHGEEVVASPADLIKVRMQADSQLISQGLQTRYAGIFDALSKIIRTEGFLGLWRGVFPNAQRAFLVNMGELACYDQAKHFIIGRRICEDNVFAHSLASVASGLSATALSCPADVIKTRMMNQAVGKETSIAYRNSYNCLVKTVKFEGILALWKGFFPTWARLGPWQFVFWVSYERLRHVSGFSSF